MRMHCYVISVKTWVFLENQHYSPNIEDIFTKFTGHPMNWTNYCPPEGRSMQENLLILQAKLRVRFILNRMVCLLY